MILVDASGVFAALDRRQPEYERARRTLEVAEPPIVLSPFVAAEIDYLLLERAGVDVEQTFLQDVAVGAYELASFDRSDVDAARAVIQRYADQRIGLADASIVVLADRYGTTQVLTLDERHFRVLRTLDGSAFTLLPADA